VFAPADAATSCFSISRSLREVCRHFGAAAEFDDEKLIVPVSELQKLHRGFARDGDFILHDVRNVKEFPNSLRDVFRSKIFDPVISSKRVQSRLEARLMTTSKDPSDDDSKGPPDENCRGCVDEQPLIAHPSAAKAAMATNIFILQTYRY
jgi:hypothetical protein